MLRSPLAAELADDLIRHVLSKLCWETCSVCSQPYLRSSGCHVWSRQVVATDAQALHAFCCARFFTLVSVAFCSGNCLPTVATPSLLGFAHVPGTCLLASS